MKNKFADLHLHISLKNYVNKLGDTIWYHKQYDAFWDRPNRSEAHEYTQSDVTSLIKGNVNLSVIALYALEDILDYSVISKLIAKSFFGFKAREVKKLRRNYNTKYGLMLYEKSFIEKGPLKQGNKEFLFVRDKADLLSDKTKLVYSIEGAHNLHGANKPQSGTFKKDILNHLLEMKNWDTPVFMMTICHFQYNHIAGQAYAIPIPGVASFLVKRVSKFLDIPDDKPRGFTPLGKEVIDLALDKNKGKRILIDLKHSSVETRKEYYEYLTKNNLIGEVPVIISHVGVSGIDTFHRQINEVDNKKPNEARNYDKFNPWGINICDEDIKNAIRIGGMIGISLDQRILGENNRSFKKSIRKTLRKADVTTNRKNLHACLWLENIFHTVMAANSSKAWDMICLSSDNGGVIDPIDCCPTANHLHHFEARLNNIAFKYYSQSEYKGKIFVPNEADLKAKLRKILYTNLNDFVYMYFPITKEIENKKSLNGIIPAHTEELLNVIRDTISDFNYKLSKESENLITQILDDEIETIAVIEKYEAYNFNAVNDKKLVKHIDIKKARIINSVTDNENINTFMIAKNNMIVFAELLIWVHDFAKDHATNFENPNITIKLKAIITTLKKACPIFPFC